MTDITGRAIPTAPLEKTGAAVTQIGLGGEGILRAWSRDNVLTESISTDA